VSHFFIFYILVDFSKETKSGFLVGFIVFFNGLFKNKTWVGFFGSGFFTTTLLVFDRGMPFEKVQVWKQSENLC